MIKCKVSDIVRHKTLINYLTNMTTFTAAAFVIVLSKDRNHMLCIIMLVWSPAFIKAHG